MLFNNVLEAAAVNVTVSFFANGETHQMGGVLITNQIGFQERNGGANRINIKAPVSLAADWGISLPTTNGLAGQTMINDGSGNMSWSTPASGSAATSGLPVFAMGTLVTGQVQDTNRVVAPPFGQVGGLSQVSFQSNLTANCMFVVTNLIFRSQLYITCNGPLATLSNINSFVWLEGSVPVIPTNGSIMLEFWKSGEGSAMVTNARVVGGMLTTVTNGPGIEMTQDPLAKTFTIGISNSVLSQIGSSGGVNIYRIVEHFVGGVATTAQIGTHGWRISGNSGTFSSQSGRPGIWQLTTTTNLTNVSVLFLGDVTATMGQGVTNTLTTNKWIVGFPGTTYYSNCIIRMGLTDSVTSIGDGVNSISIVLTNGTFASNWWYQIINASTYTTDTLAVNSGSVSFFTNELRFRGDGLVRFAVNGVESAGIAGAPITGMRLYIQVVKNIDGALGVDVDTMLFNLDEVEWNQKLLY